MLTNLCSSAIRAQCPDVAVALNASHRITFGTHTGVTYNLTGQLPGSIDVLLRSDLVLIVSWIVNGVQKSGAEVKYSNVSSHLVQYFRKNADLLGINNVSEVYLDDDGRPKINMTSSRTFPIHTSPSTATLISIDLLYVCKATTDGRTPILSRYLLNEVVDRFASYHLVKRYPLIFGPLCKRLDLEISSFPRIARSIIAISNRSLNPLFRKQVGQHFKTLKKRLMSAERSRQDALIAYVCSQRKEADDRNPTDVLVEVEEELDDQLTLCEALEMLFRTAVKPPRFRGEPIHVDGELGLLLPGRDSFTSQKIPPMSRRSRPPPNDLGLGINTIVARRDYAFDNININRESCLVDNVEQNSFDGGFIFGLDLEQDEASDSDFDLDLSSPCTPNTPSLPQMSLAESAPDTPSDLIDLEDDSSSFFSQSLLNTRYTSLPASALANQFHVDQNLTLNSSLNDKCLVLPAFDFCCGPFSSTASFLPPGSIPILDAADYRGQAGPFLTLEPLRDGGDNGHLISNLDPGVCLNHALQTVPEGLRLGWNKSRALGTTLDSANDLSDDTEGLHFSAYANEVSSIEATPSSVPEASAIATLRVLDQPSRTISAVDEDSGLGYAYDREGLDFDDLDLNNEAVLTPGESDLRCSSPRGQVTWNQV